MLILLQEQTAEHGRVPDMRILAGAIKYNFPDARYILERASAQRDDSTRRSGCDCQERF